MYESATGIRPILKPIAFLINRLNDGISEEQLSHYFSNELYNDEFVRFCIMFSVENGWLTRCHDGDRYSLTVIGREFVSTQFG